MRMGAGSVDSEITLPHLYCVSAPRVFWGGADEKGTKETYKKKSVCFTIKLRSNVLAAIAQQRSKGPPFPPTQLPRRPHLLNRPILHNNN